MLEPRAEAWGRPEVEIAYGSLLQRNGEMEDSQRALEIRGS